MHDPCRFECIVPVISSEARNLGQKTKIPQSQPLTSFETRSFEMTKVDLWRLSGGFRKRPHARLGCPHSDRNFENPYRREKLTENELLSCVFRRFVLVLDSMELACRRRMRAHIFLMCGLMKFIKPLLEIAAAHRREKGRPFVTLSYAQSLDGCISAQPGVALALSGRQSLRLTHKLRAGHDAILVGIGTVLSDNPRLNVRLVDGVNPRPIVVDSKLRLPLTCNLLKQEARPLLVATVEGYDEKRAEALQAAGAIIVALPPNPRGQVDLSLLLQRLGELGIDTLMVEGGARIITSFLFERLADFIVLTIAPVLVGGLRAVSDLGTTGLHNLLRLEQRGHRWLGEDLILWGHLNTEERDSSLMAVAQPLSR